MRYLGLHAASWLSLVTVCLMLFILNGGLIAPLGGDRWSGGYGYPMAFLSGHFLAQAIDSFFAAFVLIGAVATIEFWCRTHGAPKVTLLSLFGAISSCGLYCYHYVFGVFYQGADEGDRALNLAFGLVFLCESMIIILFGVAVVGWGKLIGLALSRR